MPLFIPDSEIYLLKDVPFSPNYENTGLFPSKEVQETLFKQKAFFHAEECTYIRETGVIRLEVPISTAYQCNYIMYRNTNFYDKWFYAFCTDVRYVNNTTSEFTFTLDYMQTWLFDYTLKQCFIERAHTGSDDAGDNLVPEGLETGEMLYSYSYKLSATYGKIYIAATFDKNLNNYMGGMSNNVYTGLCINEFASAAAATQFIQQATEANKLSGIVAVFQSINYNTQTTITVNQNQAALFQGYTPRNKKLYTYPYSFLQVLGNDGGNAIFRWEYFSTFGSGQFRILVSPSISSQMMITPTNYKGKSGYNPAERMIIENVMLCSWNGDTFKANLAQTIGKYAVPAEVAVITGAALLDKIRGSSESAPVWAGGTDASNQEEINRRIERMEVVNPAAAAYLRSQYGDTQTQTIKPIKSSPSAVESASTFTQNILSTIQKTLAAVHSPESMARQAQNPGSSTDILYMIQEKSPYFITMGISRYYAEIIDNYFTLYGYALNRSDTPWRKARERFTYLKTAGCIVEGSFPANMAQAIENIYNNGTRFWYLDGTGRNTWQYVGDYSYSNNPTGIG